MRHEKVGEDPSTGEAVCSCGELGFDHIRKRLQSLFKAEPITAPEI